MFKRRKHFDRSLSIRYIFWIQAKPRASSRKSHASFAHAQQRFDTIPAEPFLVQFSLLAKRKGSARRVLGNVPYINVAEFV